MSRSTRWVAQADAWAAWADARHEDDVLPLFYDQLGESPGRALDVGCGEGRVTRELRRRGHEAVGIDVAERLVELAEARDPGADYRVAAAERLPFPDASFELVVAFNVLMNVDDPARAIREVARVLVSGGRLSASIVHPFASAGEWHDDVFVIREYLVERPHEQQVGEIVFANAHAPLHVWLGWLEHAGLRVESIREVARPNDRRWSRLPMFLFLGAVKG